MTTTMIMTMIMIMIMTKELIFSPLSVREDISGPLGVDAFVGLTSTEIKRVSPLSQDSTRSVIRQSFRPKALGRKIDPNVFGLVREGTDRDGRS